MQIKKGPYGYYAIEKFDNPDILCNYAEEIISGNKSDFYLTPSNENFGTGLMCCFDFSGYMQITDREFSIFSSQSRSASRKKETLELQQRRKTAGDLFLSFINLMDNLISPSCLVLDPDMIFTDPDGITIKMCCLPIKSYPDNLCLSSLGPQRLEALLNCDFFRSVITEDERNALVFSVKDNDEKMFMTIAGVIRGTENECNDKQTLHETQSSAKTSFPHDLLKLSKSEKDLLVSGFSAAISLFLMLQDSLFTSSLFFILAIIILTTNVLRTKKHKDVVANKNKQEKSKQRSTILFSDDHELVKATKSDNDVQSMFSLDGSKKDNRQDTNTFKPLTSGQLTLISDSNGVNSQYSIYLDETFIGSDCFLSDIVIDDPLISPLHAVIRQRNGSFFLEPENGSGKTYIEDSPVENGKSYEIKAGQKITIGNVSFRFTLSEAMRTAYCSV